MTHPTSVKAQHFNMVVPPQPSPNSDPEVKSPTQSTAPSRYELDGIERSLEFQRQGSGYYHIQATKPQTIAYSLTDSPVGLLAWIYDKLHSWTDSYEWSDDEILVWVSIYYFS